MLGGGDRRSLIREFRAIKGLTAADQLLARRALGGKPLIVLTRAPGSKTPVRPSWQLWHDLSGASAGTITPVPATLQTCEPPLS